MKLRLLFLVLLFSFSSFGEEMVGYYIGSFDPPTEGHKAVLAAALKDKRFGLKKIYVTVNYNTDKDFNASMSERVEMLRRMFKEFGDQVEILREPLEGRPAYARYLLDKHQGKVLGIFGDDTFEKNHKIFTTEAEIANFDYIRVARPEPQAAALEAAYVPVIHDMEIEADGTSSSRVRDLIARGLNPVETGDLSQSVYDLILEKGLYPKIPEEKLAAAKAEYEARFRNFIAELKKVMPERASELEAIEMPSFKATQSLEAQHDKFVRHVVKAFNLNVEAQLVFRPLAEKILGIQYPTQPLRSPARAGIYLGSFDGPSEAQKEVIRSTLAQGKVDILYVTALGSSRKAIKLPLEERMRQLKELTAEFGDRVVVTSTPTLENSASFVRRIRNEFSPNTLMVFGSNVLQANYERLRGVDRLDFAVAPLPGEELTDLPPGTLVLDPKNRCALANRVLSSGTFSLSSIK